MNTPREPLPYPIAMVHFCDKQRLQVKAGPVYTVEELMQACAAAEELSVRVRPFQRYDRKY
jgi:hypothetical protein